MSDMSERAQRVATVLSSPEEILQMVKGTPQPRLEQPQAFLAPRTATEQTLAALWSDVIGVQPIGVHDDFFVLGGHSLMVTDLLSRIRDAFGIELPLSAAFMHTFTVAELATRVALAQIGRAERGEINAVLDVVGRLSDGEVDAMLARHAAKGEE